MKTQKYCSGCDATLPVESFGKRQYSPDGLHYLCLKHAAEQRKIYRQRKAIELQSKLDRLNERKKYAIGAWG